MQSPAVKIYDCFRILKYLFSIAAAALLLSVPGCSYEKASKIEQEKRVLGLILGGGGVSCTSPVIFSSLGPAGVTSNCVSCHGTAGGLNMTSYSSTFARVVPGNPEASVLYQKIKGGSMTQYSTPDIDSAIYCWILDGAKEN